MNVPLTHDDVLLRLGALRAGHGNRETIAAWARSWQQSAQPIGDQLLLKMVVYLAAVDLKGIARPYLYGPADFGAWEMELYLRIQDLGQADGALHVL